MFNKCTTINVNPYISSKVYFFNTPDSRAYICNETTHENILLKAESSDLWHIILTTKDYKKIIEFAKSKNLENELETFLKQLEYHDVISTGNKDITESSNSLTVNVPKSDQESFERDREKFFYKHNLFTELFFELTYKCNLKCIHCFNEKNQISEENLSFEDIKKIIDEAYNLGLYKVTLSGGECTLARDFLKTIKYIREKRLVLEIFTNGQTLYDNPELLQEILDVYPNKISLSLYSMNPEIHDKITGVAGSHKKTIEIIKLLKEKNIYVTIKSFQLNLNFTEHKAIVDFAKQTGTNLTIDTYLVLNKSKNNCNNKLTDEQLKFLANDKNSLYFVDNFKPHEINEKFLNSPICLATCNALTINPTGDIYPCPTMCIKLGNIKNQTIKEILNSQQVKEIRLKKKKDLSECFKYDYCKFCLYCQGIALRENGYLKKSDVCCQNAKIKNEIYNKIHN